MTRFYIKIADVAANALIEGMKGGGDSFVSFQQIEDYGNRVLQILSENGEEGVLVFSRAETDAFFHDYADFFQPDEKNDCKGISLRSGKTVISLIRRFRGYLALDVLHAFMDGRAVEVLNDHEIQTV